MTDIFMEIPALLSCKRANTGRKFKKKSWVFYPTYFLNILVTPIDSRPFNLTFFKVILCSIRFPLCRPCFECRIIVNFIFRLNIAFFLIQCSMYYYPILKKKPASIVDRKFWFNLWNISMLTYIYLSNFLYSHPKFRWNHIGESTWVYVYWPNQSD